MRRKLRRDKHLAGAWRCTEAWNMAQAGYRNEFQLRIMAREFRRKVCRKYLCRFIRPKLRAPGWDWRLCRKSWCSMADRWKRATFPRAERSLSFGYRRG